MVQPSRAVDFRVLFESAPGLYLVLTSDLTIVAASDAYLWATTTKRQDILGRRLFEVFPDKPDDPAGTGTRNLAASLDRVRSNRVADAMPVQKYAIRRPESEGDGFEQRFWRPINSPVFGLNGDLLYIIHRLEDVTDLVRLKRARIEKEARDLVQMRAGLLEQLEEKNKELESFSYSVSHDLLTPLRHITGFIQLLELHADDLDAESRRYLSLISSSAKEMGCLIDDLLAFSRMGRSEMMKSSVDLHALAKEVIEELDRPAAGRETNWIFGNLPHVEGDRAMLRVALINLISNALKFTRPQPAPQIEISSYNTEGNETVFYVRDNGVGFDMRYAHKLFGVFQRLHSEHEFQGTGIGLAIVHRVIDRHSGKTWAEGAVGRGATFYFSLPRTASGLEHVGFEGA